MIGEEMECLRAKSPREGEESDCFNFNSPRTRGENEVVPACMGKDFRGVTVLQTSVARRRRGIPTESVCLPELNAIRRL